MASGSITIDYSSKWKGYIEYSTAMNISTNSSSVTVSLYMRKSDGYTTGGNGAWPASITIDGSTKDCTTENGYALHQEYECIGTYTKTVYHNSDGTGSCYISAYVEGPSGTSLAGKSMSGGDTITLDKIPRASSISSANSVYFGENCSIVWTPLATSFYYKLKFSMGSWSYTTSAIAPRTTASYTYAGYIIPLEAAEQIPNTTSGKMSVSLYSYGNSSCSTQIGSTSTATFTVTLPDSVKPTIDTCILTIDNSSNDVAELWGIPLAGYTRINIMSTPSGAYGSTITSFSITGSYNVTLAGSSIDYTGNIITSSGNKQFLITCTDSRGRTSDVYASDIMTFTPYTRPKARTMAMTKNDSGQMVATATWEYDDVGGYNDAYAEIYYKVSTVSDWTLHRGVPINGEPFVLADLVPNDTISYNFKVVVTDSLGNSAEKNAFASTTQVLLDFQAGGKGLGIGKICEIDNEANGTSSLEVSMDSYFYGNMYLKGAVAMVLSAGMFGVNDPGDVISDPIVGQIYFKKVT